MACSIFVPRNLKNPTACKRKGPRNQQITKDICKVSYSAGTGMSAVSNFFFHYC